MQLSDKWGLGEKLVFTQTMQTVYIFGVKYKYWSIEQCVKECVTWPYTRTGSTNCGVLKGKQFFWTRSVVKCKNVTTLIFMTEWNQGK